jgi:hypothetical protein
VLLIHSGVRPARRRDDDLYAILTEPYAVLTRCSRQDATAERGSNPLAHAFGARKSAVADGAFDGDDVGMPRSAGGSSMLVFTGPPKCSGTTAPAITCVVPSTAVHVPMVISAPAPTAADIDLNLLYFTVDHFQIDLVSRPLFERTLL